MKTVIFDFDGTIADTMPRVIEIVNRLSDKYGFRKVMPAEVSELQKLTFREILREFKVSIPKALLIGRDGLKMFSEDVETLSVFEGIAELIGGLEKEGYRVGIITKNEPKIVEAILNKNNIKADFIEKDSTLFNKEKAIEKVLIDREIDKGKTVYVGDEIRDVEAAKKVGVKIISVCWGYNAKEALEKENDIVVDKPEQLGRVIEEVLA